MFYPELVERQRCHNEAKRAYNIEPKTQRDHARVSLIKRVFRCHPDERGLARHELGHVRWSPKEQYRAETPAFAFLLECLEDVRINLALEAAGLPVTLTTETLAKATRFVRQAHNGADFLLRTLVSIGTDSEKRVYDRRVNRQADPELVKLAKAWRAKVRKRMVIDPRTGAPARFHVFRLAEELWNELQAEKKKDEEKSPPPPPPGKGTPPGPLQNPLSLKRELVRQAIERLAADFQVPEAPKPEDEELPFLPDDDYDELDLLEALGRTDKGKHPILLDPMAKPGKMHIARPPLELTSTDKLAIRRSAVSTTEGSVLAFPHRSCIDGAVFRRSKRKNMGGTLLVDMSGSMSFAPHELERVLKATAGMGQIAGYSGRGKIGELRILAHNGKYVQKEYLHRFGHGNIVDIPALEWLASQPPPRIWLSDGGVTGEHDHGNDAITRHAKELVATYRIQRFDTADEVTNYLDRFRKARKGATDYATT